MNLQDGAAAAEVSLRTSALSLCGQSYVLQCRPHTHDTASYRAGQYLRIPFEPVSLDVQENYTEVRLFLHIHSEPFIFGTAFLLLA